MKFREQWRLVNEETRDDIREERLNLRVGTVEMQAGRADMHTDGGGCGQERDGAQMALATEALALEATGDRTARAGGDSATISGRDGWSLARMP